MTLSDTMKALETRDALPTLRDGYLYMRLDGRGFSRLTGSFQKPFDATFGAMMIAVGADLMETFRADIAYVQSDEISLAWSPRKAPNVWDFSGRRDKWLSLIPSRASAFLMQQYATLPVQDHTRLAAFVTHLPHFDARLVDGLTLEDTQRFFLWRARDCQRNAVLGLAQAHFSKKSIFGKSKTALLEDLEADGVAFARMPDAFKTGVYFHKAIRTIPASDLTYIPEAYRPVEGVERSVLVENHQTDLVSQPWPSFLTF